MKISVWSKGKEVLAYLVWSSVCWLSQTHRFFPVKLSGTILAPFSNIQKYCSTLKAWSARFAWFQGAFISQKNAWLLFQHLKIETVLIVLVTVSSNVLFIQTWLTSQQHCDWVFVVGRSKAVASGGKLLVDFCKQVFFYSWFCNPIYLPPLLIIDCLTKTALVRLCYCPHNCSFGYLQ